MSDPAISFDPSALMIALDATEQAGVPPHLVEQLRGVVRERANQLETRDAIARREDLAYRESAYSRQCAIRGPWTHVAIDEHLRGSPQIRLTCDHCNREPAPSLMALDGPPPPIRRYRHSVVEMRSYRLTYNVSLDSPPESLAMVRDRSGEVSPAIHVGRCEFCGTWYMG